jgi:drug/metabolite transporter (DMT)-like permease
VRFAGEFAALGAALGWASGSNLFAAAGRRMGSINLNRLRIAVALVLLCAALALVRGAAWPVWATPPQVGLLAASGLVGFVFGDANYFRSLIILGPGRAALLGSLAPLFTVLLGVSVLGEVPGPLALLGVVLTVGGIALVLGERAAHEHVSAEGTVAIGVLAGVLGAIGQAGGYVLSKLALRTGIDPLSATVIRATAAAAVLWGWTAWRGQVRAALAPLADRRAAGFMVAGALSGPVFGVLMSLTALVFIEAGIAASISAIYPLLAIALAARFHRERITARTAVGALVAVTGVIVLFLRPR